MLNILALSPLSTRSFPHIDLKKTPTCDGTAHITQIELKPKQYSVDSDGKLDATGQYHFEGIFAGIAYTLSATHGTQHTEKIVVFKSNKQGDPDANRHNLSLAGA